MIDMSPLIGPILDATRSCIILLNMTQCHNNDGSLLPNHLPKVCQTSSKGALSGHISRCTRVMIRLSNQ